MALNRRQFITTSSAAIAATALTPLRGLAQTPPPEAKFAAVRNGVGTFTARGGTIGWLIVPDAVIVIDSQYPDTAQVCLDGLKARAARPIDLLINTHHHADHTGGNGVFRSSAKKILAHERVPALQKMAAEEAHTEAQQTYPDATFANTWEEKLGNERVAARHYGPAHTGGDAVVSFRQANVVHMGDLVFNRAHPRVDRPAGASIANWITSLEKIAADHDRDTVYIFGHGNPKFGITGKRDDLHVMRDYLTAMLDLVRKGIATGSSRDEIAAIDTLPGFPDFAPLSPRLPLAAALGVAYDELTGSR